MLLEDGIELIIEENDSGVRISEVTSEIDDMEETCGGGICEKNGRARSDGCGQMKVLHGKISLFLDDAELDVCRLIRERALSVPVQGREIRKQV